MNCVALTILNLTILNPPYLTNSIVELTTVGNNSSINRINAKLQSFTIWDAAAIEKRQELLSNLVSEIWKIEESEVP
jgi:hypothetical protein